MSASAGQRPSPQVILVPPPAGPMGRTAAGWMIGCGLTAILTATVVLVVDPLKWLGALIIAVSNGAVVWQAIRRPGAYAAFRTKAEEVCGRQSPGHLDAALRRLWGDRVQVPDITDVLNTIASAPDIDAAGPVVIGFAPLIRLDCGDYRFEPVVIAPGDRYRQMVVVIAVGLIVGALVWLPHPLSHLIRGSERWWGAGIGLAAAGLLLFWAWQALVRPTYLRMAPGMIQILRYGWRTPKPHVHTYSVEGGTTIIVLRMPEFLRVTLVRAAARDTFTIYGRKRAEEAEPTLWQALLSTAPTPPLSSDELVG